MCCLLHVEQCKVFTESVSTIFALSLTSFFYSLRSFAKFRKLSCCFLCFPEIKLSPCFLYIFLRIAIKGPSESVYINADSVYQDENRDRNGDSD